MTQRADVYSQCILKVNKIIRCLHCVCRKYIRQEYVFLINMKYYLLVICRFRILVICFYVFIYNGTENVKLHNNI